MSAEEVKAVGRVVAVGTTVTWVLESIGQPVREQLSETDASIHLPFQFDVVGRLLTNLDLAQSTLLKLVSTSAGRELGMDA